MEINTEAIDNLIKGLDLKKGTELFGANGLVKQLTKRLVERALEAELEDHLGYPKGERGEEPKDNPRNGTTTKRVRTEYGALEIAWREREPSERVKQDEEDEGPRALRPSTAEVPQDD